MWKNSYSSAIDEVQQGLLNKVVAALKKDESDKTEASIEEAQILIDDVLTADSEFIRNWAKDIQDRLSRI